MTTNARPVLLLLSAPSGGGKTTICNALLAADPSLTRAITCTTRPPRPTEKHGRDYYFLSPGDFAQRVDAGDFLEHATVYGHRYGTLKSEVIGRLHQGRDLLLAVDVQGAAAIRSMSNHDPVLQPALVTVFVAPPSLAALQERLVKRGQDAPDVIRARVSQARRELEQAHAFDYLLVSTSMLEDQRRIRVILEAEKLRSHRARVPEL